jgi:hypothetical protein
VERADDSDPVVDGEGEEVTVRYQHPSQPTKSRTNVRIISLVINIMSWLGSVMRVIWLMRMMNGWGRRA